MKQIHLKPYPALTAALQRLSLRGKSVIVTGGGYGIGAEIAKSFAERAVSSIILVGRTESRLKRTAEALASSSPETTISYRVADIASTVDVQRLFGSLDASPDILINGAGYLPNPEPFLDTDLTEFWSGFTVNVFGTALVTQTYLRHRQTSKLGNIPPAVVITLNTAGAYSARVPFLSAYGASKAALARWSELISVDVDESTARFISLHPGAVKTEMYAKSGLEGSFPTSEGKLVGDFVVWITSEEADFLGGRFVWAGWDILELLNMKEEIITKDLLRTSLSE